MCLPYGLREKTASFQPASTGVQEEIVTVFAHIPFFYLLYSYSLILFTLS